MSIIKTLRLKLILVMCKNEAAITEYKQQYEGAITEYKQQWKNILW